MTEPTLIFETLHGSQAYGLAREGSDVDRKGIVVGPARWYLGFGEAPEQLELGPDHVRYELRKFMRLAVAANPTILEVLWTDPEDHEVTTPAGDRLLDARSAFLSRKVKDTFSGYAHGQLRRIRTHRRWLLDPPEAAPERAGFGLPERSVIPRDQLGAAQALIDQDRLEEADVSSNFLELLDRERRYRAALNEWHQYQGWLASRNPERAELERRHGYDTKHALHLVRLLRMGHEILATGEVRVRRDDREELLAIRDGAWSYDQLVGWAEETRRVVMKAAETSPLPGAPDEETLDALCVSLIEEVLA